MKKIIITLLFVQAIAILIAMPVLASADPYTYQLTMNELSGITYANTPFIFQVSNSALVSGGYLSSSGLDAQVVDGSSVPTMLTTTQTAFVDGISANGSKNVNYTTGNTPASTMPVIVGNGGSITIPENVALEPGSAFSISATGYVNTVSPSTTGNTIAGFTGSTLAQQVNQLGSTTQEVCGTNWYAQTFTASSSYIMTGAAIPVYTTVGTQTTSTLALYATTSNLPTGSALASGTFTAAGSAAWNAVTFGTPYTLTSGVTYALVADQPSGTSSIYFVWGGTPSTPYYDLSTNSGAVWAAGSTYTFGYETFGNKPITLTAGANTITPTTLGTFNVQIQSGCSATATSGSSCLVTNSPVQLGQGISVITTTGAVTGGFTVTLNTTAYILNKPSALSMSVDSTTSGKIDATLTGSSGVTEQSISGGSSPSSYKVYGVNWIAQDFVASGAYPLAQVTTGCGGINGGGGLFTTAIYIETTSSGSPTGTIVVSGSAASGGGTITFGTPYSLTNGTTYAMVLNYTGGNSTNYFSIGPYTVGGTGFYASANSGTSWAVQSGYEFPFTTQATFPNTTINVTGVSSGAHTITLSETAAAFGTLSLQVDSGTPSTATIVGPVPSNSNVWTLDTNDVMPYITSYSETVGSTQKLLYQPVTMIVGTVLPDIDGTQAGTITYGTNPNVSLTLGTFGPTNPAQATTGNNYAIQSPGSILSSTLGLPPQMYTELDASLIPFGAAINSILLAGGIPQALWWFPFIYIFVCIVGMLVYEGTGPKGAPQLGSLMAMCVAVEILLVLFAVLGTVGVSGMIPLWSAILFIFPAVALILARKHVGWG
jgi:hypothetical protein